MAKEQSIFDEIEAEQAVTAFDVEIQKSVNQLAAAEIDRDFLRYLKDKRIEFQSPSYQRIMAEDLAVTEDSVVYARKRYEYMIEQKKKCEARAKIVVVK